MDFSSFKETVIKDAIITGKKTSHIFLDMAYCGFKYGAGYADYDLFEMYNLTSSQRNTYLTRGRNNALVKKYCDHNYMHLFVNKDEFNYLFNDLLKREWVDVKDNKEEVFAFLNKHQFFMAKPVDGQCGKSILKLNRDGFINNDEIYDFLINLNMSFILEEIIIQNKEVSKIYPKSINTLRVVTLLTYEGDPYLKHLNETFDNKKVAVNVLAVYMRIGNKNKFVDNFNSNGLVLPVNLETGTLTKIAIDKQKNAYLAHPETDFVFEGFKIPYFNETLELAKKAALKVKPMGYVGWDIAISDKGPVIVEGNDFPGHDIYQNPIQNKDKIGMMVKIWSYEKHKTK